MPHEPQLIGTIALGLTAAFVGGFLAARMRLPPIVGYLLAGVVVGPFTPGFVADAELASQLAELGVILLMFGVGVHFSLRDLLEVRGIAIPGAIGQIIVATLLGMGLATWWGWNIGGGLVLGLALAVASTVVLLRALMEHNTLESVQGRVAVGWLIVEDLFTVLVLVLLPAFAGVLGGSRLEGANNWPVIAQIGLTLGKVAVLIALMLIVGGRVVPWLLVQVARTGSRELFVLAILAVALGIAFGAATLFGVSLALGAFLAGLVISEPDLSHHTAKEALPLRDAFAVLFFVSVGMLLDPAYLIAEPVKILAVLVVIILGKGLAALLIVLAFGHPVRTGLTVAAGLAQIGEFSFILAELGRDLQLLPGEGHSLLLAGALISIMLNPLIFRTIGPLESWMRGLSILTAFLERRAGCLAQLAENDREGRHGHVVLCGHGRVGRVIADVLTHLRLPFVVIEQDRRRVEELREQGAQALFGDAATPALLAHADLATAAVLVVAIPDPPAIRHIVGHAQRVNPEIRIVARTHSASEREYLRAHGVEQAVLGELELALAMTRHALVHVGVATEDIDGLLYVARGRDGADSTSTAVLG